MNKESEPVASVEPRCLKDVLAEMMKTQQKPKDATVEAQRIDYNKVVIKLGCLANSNCSAWRIVEGNIDRGTWHVPRRPIGDLALNKKCSPQESE